jgi:hypothetical protein
MDEPQGESSVVLLKNENTLIFFLTSSARDYLPNLSILVSRGKEIKRDSPSSGERKGSSLNHKACFMG